MAEQVREMFGGRCGVVGVDGLRIHSSPQPIGDEIGDERQTPLRDGVERIGGLAGRDGEVPAMGEGLDREATCRFERRAPPPGGIHGIRLV